MKYVLLTKDGKVFPDITIDESAKKDFMEMMDWNEMDWDFHTERLYYETMHEMYGDGSDHKCCPKCGLCIDCGDCKCEEVKT